MSYTPSMNFALTPQMIDKIAFAMEDQKEKLTVDMDTGELVPLVARSAEHAEEKYVRLPHWGSAEGFHLMESFITSLANPAYREQLSRALTMGRGVFRAFKDALKQNKEIEKLWFTYKEERLRAVIEAEVGGAVGLTDEHGQPWRVTGSFGVAAFGPGLGPESFIKRADEAVYAAKRAGKNQVLVAEGRLLLPGVR